MDVNEQYVEVFRVATERGVTTPEGLQEVFAEKGITMTVDEVLELCEKVGTAYEKLQASGEELDENNLEQVAGGIAITTLVLFGGALALGIWNGYNRTKRGKKTYY